VSNQIMNSKKLTFSQIIAVVGKAGVIVMPTDTVYGLVCSAKDPDSVARMYQIKKREGKPGTLIAANVEQLSGLGFSKVQLSKAEQFWPGPVSVVLDAPGSLEYLHMGLKSLAVRIPAPEWLRDLLEQTGPLATTSANFTGEPTVTRIEQAQKLFGDQVDLYVDGGDLSSAKPSSIIRLNPDGTTEKLR
jgi:tRNA threonylcarbamoyl adenosine modification protein (Sua5/YciO/YrdC/YwlC family)